MSPSHSSQLAGCHQIRKQPHRMAVAARKTPLPKTDATDGPLMHRKNRGSARNTCNSTGWPICTQTYWGVDPAAAAPALLSSCSPAASTSRHRPARDQSHAWNLSGVKRCVRRRGTGARQGHSPHLCAKARLLDTDRPQSQDLGRQDPTSQPSQRHMLLVCQTQCHVTADLCWPPN
jgi:hypothetical protein